ncbi:MAG: hypothetical protein D6715_00170 [Calditrichaeota bacterium]|nr:MAG: hypothetical protein D6715_00170 [Calditrichota bacterium]
MRMLSILLTFVLLATGPAEITIRGQVLGADGKPLPVSHVHLGYWKQGVSYTFLTRDAGPDGRFQVTLTEPGYYELWATGIWHYPAVAYLPLNDSTDTIRLTFQLKPYRYRDPVDSVAVIGSWNEFNFSSALPMEKTPDGRFRITVSADADTVFYQLVGVEEEDRSINGTRSDFYQYDGGGDYRSGLKARKGQPLEIVFDPGVLPRYPDDPSLPRIRFDASHGFLNKIDEIQRHLEKLKAAYARDLVRRREAFLPGTPQLDGSSLFDALGAPLQSDNQTLRHLAALTLLESTLYGVELPPAMKQKVLEALPAVDHPDWAMNPLALNAWVALKDSSQQQWLLRKFLERNPAKTVQAQALILLLFRAKGAGDLQKQRELYQRLQAGYADLALVQPYLKFFNPDSPIRPGAPVPDFEVTLLDSPRVVTAADFKGRYLLLDFWATWCAPCVAEIPVLEEAYRRFHPLGLEILSLSLDRDESVVKKFRRQRHAMPWLHALLKGGFNDPVARAFDVQGIPRPVLVGPEGNILAVEGDLRGEKLVATLNQYLKVQQDRASREQ